jgi:arylsulfatase
VRYRSRLALLVALASFVLTSAPIAQQPPPPSTPQTLPPPDFRFPGAVGRTYQDSDPGRFPQPVQAPTGAPNVVLILIDDAGFGQFSTFGGGVPSPTMDRLAAEGLRFNRFHTTALCSPTRAALITGRNHHSVAAGVIGEAATGYDGSRKAASRARSTRTCSSTASWRSGRTT